MTTPIITIPKKLSKGEDLVVVRKRDFEAFQKWQEEVSDAVEKVRRGRKEYRQKKTIVADSRRFSVKAACLRCSVSHYTSDFQKAYKKLPPQIQDVLDDKDSLFRQNPFHKSLRTHKLHGQLEGLWSFWVSHSYRVLFEFVKDEAIFYDIGTHEIYR